MTALCVIYKARAWHASQAGRAFAWFHESTVCALPGDHKSHESWFQVKTGFKQGDVNAAIIMLFNLFWTLLSNSFHHCSSEQGFALCTVWWPAERVQKSGTTQTVHGSSCTQMISVFSQIVNHTLRCKLRSTWSMHFLHSGAWKVAHRRPRPWQSVVQCLSELSVLHRVRMHMRLSMPSNMSDWPWAAFPTLMQQRTERLHNGLALLGMLTTSFQSCERMPILHEFLKLKLTV